MKNKIYHRPVITQVILDNEINIHLSSLPPGDPPQMQMMNSMEEDEGVDYYFFNPLKWFK